MAVARRLKGKQSLLNVFLFGFFRLALYEQTENNNEDFNLNLVQNNAWSFKKYLVACRVSETAFRRQTMV